MSLIIGINFGAERNQRFAPFAWCNENDAYDGRLRMLTPINEVVW